MQTPSQLARVRDGMERMRNASPRGVRVYMTFVRRDKNGKGPGIEELHVWHAFISAVGYGARVRGAIVGRIQGSLLSEARADAGMADDKIQFDISNVSFFDLKRTPLRHVRDVLSRSFGVDDAWVCSLRFNERICAITKRLRTCVSASSNASLTWSHKTRRDGERPCRPPCTPPRSRYLALSCTSPCVDDDGRGYDGDPALVHRACHEARDCAYKSPVTIPTSAVTCAVICRFHPRAAPQYVLCGSQPVCEGGLCTHVMSFHRDVWSSPWDVLIVVGAVDGHRRLHVYTCLVLNTRARWDGRLQTQRLPGDSVVIPYWTVVYAWSHTAYRKCRYTRVALYEAQCIAARARVPLLAVARWSWVGYELSEQSMAHGPTAWLYSVGFKYVDHPTHMFVLPIVDYRKYRDSAQPPSYPATTLQDDSSSVSRKDTACSFANKAGDDEQGDEEFITERRDEDRDSPHAPKAFEISLSQLNQKLLNSTICQTQQYMLPENRIDASRFVEAFVSQR